MKKDYVEICLILDKSGSMSSMKEHVVKGFNEFIWEQKKSLEDKEVKFSLVLFDDVYQMEISGREIKTIAEMNYNDYKPDGCTALLDAIGITTKNFGKRFAEMDESKRPEKVIIAILTDGEENSSVEYTASAIKEMISEQEDKYGWTYMFLSSDLSSLKNAQKFYGFSMQNTALYSQDAKSYQGSNSVYHSMSKTIRNRVDGDSDSEIKVTKT